MATIDKITLSAKIYSKRCPKCGRDNLESSYLCWNCDYEFPDQVAHAHEKSHWWSNFFVTLVFIAAVIIIVLIILDAAR